MADFGSERVAGFIEIRNKTQFFGMQMPLQVLYPVLAQPQPHRLEQLTELQRGQQCLGGGGRRHGDLNFS